MFDFNPGLMVWTVLTFLVLLVVLSRYAWKPLLKSLQEREDKIRQALEQAERARVEAGELLKQNEKNLAKAEEEYQRIIREGKVFAEKLKDEVVAKAHQQAQREIQLAKDEIQRDVHSAKQQLRNEVADLAVQAAGKILDETLDVQKHKKIIDKFLSQLPNS